MTLIQRNLFLAAATAAALALGACASTKSTTNERSKSETTGQ